MYNGLEGLINFLEQLELKKIYFRLNKIRDSILVETIVPGERWEIEFMKDGKVVIEKFITDCTLYDESELDVLLKNF